MPIDWREKVENAIANLNTAVRVVPCSKALAIIDDVVSELPANEFAAAHGIKQDWVRTVLGHVTTATQAGGGEVLPLESGGWYAFKADDQPFEVSPGFAAAWKKACGF